MFFYCCSYDATTPSSFKLGRLTNHGDLKRNQNARMKVLDVNDRPVLCLFALKSILAGKEILHDYGIKELPWRQHKGIYLLSYVNPVVGIIIVLLHKWTHSILKLFQRVYRLNIISHNIFLLPKVCRAWSEVLPIYCSVYAPFHSYNTCSSKWAAKALPIYTPTNKTDLANNSLIKTS